MRIRLYQPFSPSHFYFLSLVVDIQPSTSSPVFTSLQSLASSKTKKHTRQQPSSKRKPEHQHQADSMPFASELEAYRRDERLGHKLLTPEERLRLIRVRTITWPQNPKTQIPNSSNTYLCLMTALPPFATVAFQVEITNRIERFENTRRTKG